LGIPLWNVRPSPARAATVSNSSSILSAGRTCTRTFAGRSPAFANRCDVPAGDHLVARLGGHPPEPLLEPHRPARELEPLLLRRVDVTARHTAAGRHLQLEREELAPGVVGRRREDEALPRHRVSTISPACAMTISSRRVLRRSVAEAPRVAAGTPRP
jgi:hypothetical protein